MKSIFYLWILFFSCGLLVLTPAGIVHGVQKQTSNKSDSKIDMLMKELVDLRQLVAQNETDEGKRSQEILWQIKEVQSQTWISQVAAPVFGLLGAIVGGFATYCSTKALMRRQIEQDRRNLQSAFAGEISAILTIVEQRNYRQHLADLIAQIRATNLPNVFVVPVREEYFWIYKQNSGRLGILRRPLPQDIAIFYTIAFSILEDLRNMAQPNFGFPSANHAAAFLQNLLDLFNQAHSIGARIVEQIDGEAV